MMERKLVVVDHQGYGDFLTIQTAIDAAAPSSHGCLILIREGVYYENIHVNKPNLTLVGEPGKGVSVVSDQQSKNNGTGARSFSASPAPALITGDDFSAENIVFVNAAPSPAGSEEAAALCIQADRVQFHHCGFLSCRTAVKTAPLALRSVKTSDFQSSGSQVGRHYFKGCYIEGRIDISAASSLSVFEYCKIHSSIHRADHGGGTIAAAWGPREKGLGYVFLNCIIAPDVPTSHLQSAPIWKNERKPSGLSYKRHLMSEQHPVFTKAESHKFSLENIFKDASWCKGTQMEAIV